MLHQFKEGVTDINIKQKQFQKYLQCVCVCVFQDH